MRAGGELARVWRIFHPRFLAVEMTDLRMAKVSAPPVVRKQPEIFIRTFIIRMSCSARLLENGTAKSKRKRSTSLR
jgi:hypothetical protein